MSDSEVVSEALAALGDMYGAVPTPKDALARPIVEPGVSRR